MTFPSQLRRLGTFSFLFLGAVAFTGCTTSGGGESSGILTQEAYLKASNTGAGDFFSTAIAFDGDTLVVGAPFEDSNATGVNGDQANNSASAAGAVYVFVRTNGVWAQQAYLKASNTGAGDNFGSSVALNGDTLVVGAPEEASNAVGVNNDQTNNSASGSGAVYVFTRSGTTWSQQAYLKASNTGAGDQFGHSVAIDGDTLVVGATEEASNAIGINGDETNNSASGSGAVYVFTRSGTTWSQEAYLKASNTEAGDNFGRSVALSSDTVVVGASLEDSNAIGVNGSQADNSASGSGAVYVFTRSGTTWTQQAYLKASNTETGDNFGSSVALSSDAVAVGAFNEDSNATGVNGDQTNNSASGSGAVYVFTRTNGVWSQQAYLKASNTESSDQFGHSVAASGEQVAVGANTEGGALTGVISGTPSEAGTGNGASISGAAYLFAP